MSDSEIDKKDRHVKYWGCNIETGYTGCHKSVPKQIHILLKT